MKTIKDTKNDYTVTDCETKQECINACKELIKQLNWEKEQMVDDRVTEIVDYDVYITGNDEDYYYKAHVCRRFENVWNNVAVAEHPEHGAIKV